MKVNLFIRPIAIAIYIFIWSEPVASNELLMFRQALCEYCEVWDREIGVIYNKTSEGQQYPLRKINISEAHKLELGILKPVIFSPTFVLVKDDMEIGRIVGYVDESFFWGQLNSIIRAQPDNDRVTEIRSQ